MWCSLWWNEKVGGIPQSWEAPITQQVLPKNVVWKPTRWGPRVMFVGLVSPHEYSSHIPLFNPTVNQVCLRQLSYLNPSKSHQIASSSSSYPINSPFLLVKYLQYLEAVVEIQLFFPHHWPGQSLPLPRWPEHLHFPQHRCPAKRMAKSLGTGWVGKKGGWKLKSEFVSSIMG